MINKMLKNLSKSFEEKKCSNAGRQVKLTKHALANAKLKE